ncbi:MAG TPA: peptide MFS transporter [Candidatus Angelobacter sp.]|jgi:POT family proton-dependent oligopeptide transporter|nr:peptide MFS transporter [Candidatus Angelobacter sp.]
MDNTPAPAPDTRFFGHPRGLATLFFTEMWERYSFYGTRALLELYMIATVATGGLGFSVASAGAVYGFYTAMVYLLTVPGGWVADRFIGQRRAVLYGGILISSGNFCLVAGSVSAFYAGLGLMMIGTGLLKANVSTLVGQLYTPGDQRRDSGFSIFYMGINIGAFASPLIGGWVANKWGWRWGFLTAAIGMVLGLTQYVLTGKYLGSAGLKAFTSADPVRDRRQKITAAVAALGGVAVIVVIVVLGSTGVLQITKQAISNWLGWVLAIISAVVFSWMIFSKGWSVDERKRAVAIFVLFIAAAIFWASFEQAGSSLNLFGQLNTNRRVFGYEFPAAWFQSVQPLLVIIFAPVFAWLWLALGRREPSSPSKFALGLLFGGLAFAIMVPAASGGLASPWWLIGCYFLQTVGELCLSPVGLSAMTKLAPQRAVGFIMGIWFLASSIGNWLAGKAGSLFESMPLPNLFGWVAGIAFAAALVLALLIKPTKRMMGGVN